MSASKHCISGVITAVVSCMAVLVVGWLVVSHGCRFKCISSVG
jgi:hypothetical protein